MEPDVARTCSTGRTALDNFQWVVGSLVALLDSMPT